MSDTLDLARVLMRRPSVTPDDAGCLDVIGERLTAAGFQVERLPFDDVDNLWAVRGHDGPLLVFAGHTDVVPPGPETEWQSPPFEPTERDGFLYGRGAADMKGSLAAMITAVERFVTDRPTHTGRIGFLLTSDEEGPAVNGTARVIRHLQDSGESIDWCIVGEPSSREQLGDTMRVGRRGSLTGYLSVEGTQGHVAYPEQAANPIHTAAPFLTALTETVWDEGNEAFPPTTLQVVDIHGGNGVTNVIPGECRVTFNFRFSTASSMMGLQTRVVGLLLDHDVRYRLTWTENGEPFLTPPGTLTEAVTQAVRETTGITPELSTGGGTSDGRFIAPTGAQVVELGPVNATIHQVNECVRIEDLDRLSALYERCLQRLLGEAAPAS